MNFIIDFYKELDTLNLIIFWGIIIVIILLLIFSMILINKNKKLKILIEKQKDYEEELPIIKEDEIIEKKIEEEKKEEVPIITETNDTKKDNIEYRHNLFEQSIIEKREEIKETKEIEIPSAPYQRNVLREMSLSQTSPIGINREINNTNKKVEIIKDLNESLNEETIDKTFDIREEDKNKIYLNEQEQTEIESVFEDNNEFIPNELSPNFKEDRNHDLNNNEYLEEVSRKLAEAEIPDEIERTNYELKQEEDAIISYKELMEKKDTIQTVDEEDAIISIEELMNRTNQEKDEEISKLYNLSEEEENENFIKELKQFRNDL